MGMNPLRTPSWSPYVVGAGIGVLSWFAFATANHPIGITTAFEDTAALAARAAAPVSEQRRLHESARVAEGRPPRIGWEWMLVLGVFFGALVSAVLSGTRSPGVVPELWRQRFGDSTVLRLLAAFLGGGLMMFGARLAGGCTSGHGISGSLQLALSSWLFVIVLFATAVPSAFVVYGREGRTHV